MIPTIVNINSPDTGGQCYKLSKMINDQCQGQWISRAFTTNQNYLMFPVDIMPPIKDVIWLKQYFAEASVVHVHNKWAVLKRWPPVNVNAGFLFHQHGRNKDVHRELEGKRCIHVVSTFNLMHYLNEKENYNRWFPMPMDIPNINKICRQFRCQKKEDKIRIVHAPTMRRTKHTDVFLKVMKNIMQRHKNVELVLIENKTNLETLQIKSICDICYDQLLLQHGTNGLESMAMNQPVIAGCVSNPHTLDVIRQFCGREPFLNTTETTLESNIEELIVNESLRKEYAKIGREYVLKWHTPPYVTDLALRTYKEAMEMKK